MKISHEISRTKMLLKKTMFTAGEKHFHWHEKIEIVLCLDKSFNILIDGVNYPVKKGDLIVIDEKMIHKFSVHSDNTRVILGQFPYSILLNSGVVPVPINPIIKAEEIASDKEFERRFNNILDILLNESHVDNEEKNPFMQSMFAALYFMLMVRFPREAKSNCNVAIKKEKADFYRIVEYVNDNFRENITVQSIAQEFFISRGRLSKMFSKYAGVPLNHYVNSLRISEAIHLIENGTGITEAAFESGFQSIRTFNDVYKKIINSNPRNMTKK